MYLSWTDDVPIVYLDLGHGNVQAECLILMGVHVGGDCTKKPTSP
jgi:hypothetical protein